MEYESRSTSEILSHFAQSPYIFEERDNFFFLNLAFLLCCSIRFFSVELNLLDRLHHLALWVKQRISQLNLFESRLSWNSDERRQTEIITTRLYVVLLSLCITIASIYTSSIFQTEVFTVKNPSKATFDEINKNPSWSPTLACPCQNLTIPYRRFVQISPRFHQICSSDFVSSDHQWIKLFSPFLFDDTYPYDGFRRFITPQFRALASLCTIANGTVTDALSAFMSSALISEQAMSMDTVQSQITSAVAQFELSTTRAFTMTFNHVKDMVTGNRVISSSLSNWYFADTYGLVPFTNVPRSYGNGTCLCDKSPTCSAPAWIDQWVIPGFRVGCYPVESLLQSTLECLYDIECINQIIPNDTRSSIAFQALDKALSSSTVTVESLVDTLMRSDGWKLNINYDHYYSACAPLNVRTRASDVLMACMFSQPLWGFLAA